MIQFEVGNFNLGSRVMACCDGSVRVDIMRHLFSAIFSVFVLCTDTVEAALS